MLLLDLKGFFPNASHALLYQRHRELILNPELQNLADTVIQYSPMPDTGPGLAFGRGAFPTGNGGVTKQN